MRRPARSDDTRQREVLGGANSPPELVYAARVEAWIEETRFIGARDQLDAA